MLIIYPFDLDILAFENFLAEEDVPGSVTSPVSALGSALFKEPGSCGAAELFDVF